MTAVAQAFRPAVIGPAVVILATGVLQALRPAAVGAQAPAPIERVTFADAIRRAIDRNPSTAIAAAGIVRAEALLAETRSTARLQVSGNVTTTTLNRGVQFAGATVTPRNQLLATVDVRMPLYAPARWARAVQAGDAIAVAEANREDVRRHTALATADAYLTIIARRRVVDANERARDVAKAHYDLAHQLQERGTGSRLNELRAQQELSIDEGLVESARLAVYRAQEALGVLLLADGPVDTADEPGLEIPAEAIALAQPSPIQGARPLLEWRPDLRLVAAEQRAAERVVRDTSLEYRPSLDALFQPSTTYPSPFFLPQNSWRLLLQLSLPVYDSGQRQGLRAEREAALEISRAALTNAVTAATSEVRTAREAIASAERGLATARAAADQAQQVVTIVNVSFRAGAATNIEVIDAERRARDADTAVAVAEDTLRRARLELLTALGRFP